MLPAEVRRARQLAFKTGTSYGFRDAWAVGYDPEVTIAVWAGRPDGTPIPGITGRMTAAPVLFKIADLLGPASTRVGPKPPPEGALLVARRNLPPGLRRLDPGPVERVAQIPAGRKSSIRRTGRRSNGMARGCRSKPPAAAAPLRWLADGKPLPPGGRAGRCIGPRQGSALRSSP